MKDLRNEDSISAKEIMDQRVERLEKFHTLVLEASEEVGMHEEIEKIFLEAVKQ